MMKSEIRKPDTFLYFAYGDNMVKFRMKMFNPSAELVSIARVDNYRLDFDLGIGRLEDHQLDFIKYSEHWRGTSATIVPNPGSHVWGAIWRLHNDDMPALDKQEGVESNWYFAKNVDIILQDGSQANCRTYQQTINPPVRKNGEELPEDRRPCITYLDCIVNGAIECKLPEYYIEELKKIPNNGQEASPSMIEKLNRTS